MATFTSVGDGNWNDGATWGMTSPGTKGTDWPGIAGDIVNIGTTANQSHVVTYNVSETAELGTVTIGAATGTGTPRLDFSPTTDTLLCIAAGTDIVIQVTGELRVGNEASPILADHTAEIRFNPNNDNARGIDVRAGGKYYFYGDHDYYGDDYDAYLASNWTTGQTFTVVGDFTTKWRAGQLLYVHKGTTYSAVATDNAAVTIDHMDVNGSNTDITIVEAFPTGTFYANGDVINLSRNVKLMKSGGSSAVGNANTNRWRIYDANTVCNTVGYCGFSNVEIMGMYRLEIQTPLNLERTVIRNGGDGPYQISGIINNAFASVIVVSVGGAHISACKSMTFTDTVVTGGGGVWSNSGVTFTNTVRFYGAATQIAGASGEPAKNKFSGCVYSCTNAMYDGNSMIFENASLGFDLAGNEKANINLVRFGGASYDRVYFRSCKLPASPEYLNRNNVTPYPFLICFENYNRVLNDHRIVGGYGDSIKVVADNSSSRPVQRSGGNTDVIEITTQSNCNIFRYFYGFLEQSIWATGGVSKTYRYYVQTDFDSLPASEIELKGEYINEATNHTITEIVSTQGITIRANSADWSQYVSVTINPAEDGWVRLSTKIMGYESTKKIWVDPKTEIF